MVDVDGERNSVLVAAFFIKLINAFDVRNDVLNGLSYKSVLDAM